MATAIISVMTGIPVRHDVAMTGEITLRGRVLPIGGLKEKLLAAARAALQDGADPRGQRKDLTEISDAIKGGMEIIPVARLDDVVSRALVRSRCRSSGKRTPRSRSSRKHRMKPARPDGALIANETTSGASGAVSF